MDYMLTEVHRYVTPRRYDTFDTGGNLCTVTPGLVSETAAREMMGHDFEAAIRLGVLVPVISGEE